MLWPFDTLKRVWDKKRFASLKSRLKIGSKKPRPKIGSKNVISIWKINWWEMKREKLHDTCQKMNEVHVLLM